MNRISISNIFITVMFSYTTLASADVVEKQVKYTQGGVNLIGFEYSDSELPEKSPGILVFSDWMGIGDFAKERAKELAEGGYRTFVADIYGEAKRAKDQTEAGQLATKYKSDRPLLRARAQAALEALLKDPNVDPKHVGAIGFCFGGTAALELARAGAPLNSVVSFHGGLDTPDKSLAKNIKARLLILHGADDPFVPPAEVAAFEDEMTKAKVTWELTKYSGTVHAFTNPEAGSDNSKGAAYNELAAGRAFLAMDQFFSEQFAEDFVDDTGLEVEDEDEQDFTPVKPVTK